MAQSRHERLKWARAAGHRRASDAARALGLPLPTYMAHENGSREFDADSGQVYARRFKVGFEWLMTGKGEPRKALPSPAQEPARRVGARLDPTLEVRPVPVIGAVQAGVWLASVEWPIEVYPHGSIVVCVKFLDLGRDPRHGERVVALRLRHGECEATVKEFRVDRDGKPRLWPRSSHPDFQQPVLVEKADDGEETQIAYLVIGSYRPEA